MTCELSAIEIHAHLLELQAEVEIATFRAELFGPQVG